MSAWSKAWEDGTEGASESSGKNVVERKEQFWRDMLKFMLPNP